MLIMVVMIILIVINRFMMIMIIIIIVIRIIPDKNMNHGRQHSIYPTAIGSASGNPDFHDYSFVYP